VNDDALIRRVLACCYTVHRELGAGYPETTYQRAVTRELEKAGIAFKREELLPVLYQGEEIDQVQVDFLVERMILEIVAKGSWDKQDFAHAHACLRASGFSRGLLVNFGAEELQHKPLSTAPRSKV
jgi:GxxExxY protein